MSLLFKYFLSRAKADLLLTDGGSSAHSNLPWLWPALSHGWHQSVSW